MSLNTNPRRPLGVVGRTPFIIALMLASALGRVFASPLHNHISARNLGNTPPEPPPASSFDVAIWVPVIVGVVFLIGFMILSWKRGVFSKLAACLSRRGQGRRAGPATLGARELTAEQLVGAINNNGATTAGNAGRTRRHRRPRRTPSQISTTSLPAYNKEPGEEELVIFRGRDAEDLTMPAAVVMSAVDEDGEGDSLNSGDHSQVSRYSPMPTSPNSMPLLQGDESGDVSLQSINAESAVNTEAQENSSLPDPRGEAPPYFEVVDEPEGPRREVAMTQSPVALVAPPLPLPNSPEQRPQRQSTFRNLLNRMSVVSTSHYSHTRVGSDNSITTSSFSHATREGGTSRASHRPTPSGSSSHLASSMFRTLSRQRSTNTLGSNRLNSPSTISLNSISAPLTHTLSRTEFTYPKAGPTPEQLKVISSRDSFARFAVPYGADAIAFASSSRQDLNYPPPDFDAAASDTYLPRSAGPSRLRASSNVAELLQHQEEEADSPEEEQGQGESQAQQSSPPLSSSSSPPAATSTAPADSAVPQSAPSSSLLVPQPITKSDSISKASTNSTIPALSLSIPLPPTIKGTSTSTASSSSTASISEFGHLTTLTAALRSESRASNYSDQSFATAAESMGRSTPRRNATGASEPTTPTTPRVGAGHELEASDSTVMMTPIRTNSVVGSGSVRSTR